MKRVTLADIALHAGVSRATASLVVRETGTLSDSTRERVRASMEELGYVYHRGAASLRGRRTQTVGFILPELATGFWAQLSVGLEERLAEAGVVTLTVNSFDDENRQDLLYQSVLERQVDGLIVVPSSRTGLAFGDKLARGSLPTVVLSRDLRRSDIPYVGFNNVLGGRLAGEHLVTHGVRRVAYLGGLATLALRRDRMTGLKQMLRSGEAPADVVLDLPGPSVGDWGFATTVDLMKSGDFADAIVCHNDAVAFGVLRALQTSALHRPISVVSYDNVAEAALWVPALTTVAASGHEVGRRSADALLSHISDPQQTPKRVLIQPHLVVRQSCGCSERVGTAHAADHAPH